MFGGVNITVSIHAVERKENWPNKRRSKRLIKKLTKLRGPQITYAPCAFKTPLGLVVHPTIYAQLKERSHP